MVLDTIELLTMGYYNCRPFLFYYPQHIIVTMSVVRHSFCPRFGWLCDQVENQHVLTSTIE